MEINLINPQRFKLRIVWGFEIDEKFYCEYNDYSWVPKVGEIIILPLKEGARSYEETYCHKFFVEVVAY
ncbi:MAG: hypothetical protein MJK14_17540, partial [Rivularia sp. ALOHA_DT_140]|nr:hypothetical protein [Rivularia sp. ALOHA_DT_140]